MGGARQKHSHQTQSNAILFGQPAGLWVLASFEALERFSYYAMRSLLILYLLELLASESTWSSNSQPHIIGIELIRLVFSKPDTSSDKEIGQLASSLYGLYTSIAYLLSPLAGLIADRVTGQTKLILSGAGVISIGHIMLAFKRTFFIGLLFVASGTALVKPNVSTQIGMLFRGDQELEKQRAFSIFYVFINLGAFISPLVAGALHESLGFGPAFLSAACGMFLSLAAYVIGYRHLPPDARTSQSPHPRPSASLPSSSCAPAHHSASRQYERLNGKSFLSDRTSRLLAIGIVCFHGVFFWAVYEQQGNSVQRLFDEGVNRSLGNNVTIPAEYVQSLNPILILVFTPLINCIWRKLAKRRNEPSELMKMALGTLIVAAAYGLLTIASAAGLQMNMLWVCAAIVLWTTGELLTSPVALAWVTSSSASNAKSFSMALWLFSTGIGNWLAGLLGSLYVVERSCTFFGIVASVCALNGGGWLLTRPLIEKLAPPQAEQVGEGEDDDETDEEAVKLQLREDYDENHDETSRLRSEWSVR